MQHAYNMTDFFLRELQIGLAAKLHLRARRGALPTEHSREKRQNIITSFVEFSLSS